MDFFFLGGNICVWGTRSRIRFEMELLLSCLYDGHTYTIVAGCGHCTALGLVLPDPFGYAMYCAPSRRRQFDIRSLDLFLASVVRC